MADFDPDVHVRAGLELGGDNYAKLEYRLGNGRAMVYPADETPDDPEAKLIGLIESHKAPDGSWCGGWVGFTNVEGADEQAKHQLESIEPLTVSPSLLCRRCGNHGFIRESRWVPA